MTLRRPGALAILALAASAFTAAAAAGATVSYSPSGGLVIEGDATAETLRVQVQSESFRVIKDNGPTLLAGSGCSPITAPFPLVACPISFQGAISRTVTARLGDGADDISFIIDAGATPVPASLDGGGGNDTITAGVRPGAAGGDPSDPVGGGGPNAAVHLIEGGPGDDLLLGDSGGTDTLRGGAGDDTLRAHATSRSADLFDGGAGVDVADYSARTEAVALTVSNLGTPIANDGGLAEGDDLDAVETLIGGRGADTLEVESVPTLVGTPGPNPPSPSRPTLFRLRGNAGADALRAVGAPPLTSMDGGAGRDIVSGGGGVDDIFSRDGERDKIGCGKGLDRLTSDLKDVPVPADCEAVTTSDRREGPNVTVVTRIAAVDEGGLVRVRLACPRAVRIGCVGDLVAGLDRRGARFGPPEAYSLRPGRSTVVEVALRPGQVPGARRAGARVRIRSTETGVHGPKTTQRSLAARAG